MRTSSAPKLVLIVRQHVPYSTMPFVHHCDLYTSYFWLKYDGLIANRLPFVHVVAVGMGAILHIHESQNGRGGDTATHFWMIVDCW